MLYLVENAYSNAENKKRGTETTFKWSTLLAFFIKLT